MIVIPRKEMIPQPRDHIHKREIESITLYLSLRVINLSSLWNTQNISLSWLKDAFEEL